MSSIQIKIIGVIVCYIAIFISGYWLSKLGQPFNTIILNIHKLIALALFIFLIITICRINKISALSTLELTICIITGAFFLFTIISGGLVSINKPLPDIIKKVHHISPYLTVLCTAFCLYFLLTRKQ